MSPPGPASSRYRFVRRIATGGMAELYLGEATGVGGVKKRVALKRILPAFVADTSFVEMFLAEARLASTLQHPNIVQTYDVLQSEGEYIIVMEYLEGLDLQQVKRRAREVGVGFSVNHALHVGLSALAGLHYAHERVGLEGQLGIVHRDVSPHNLFLTYDGGVKLLDFGIAVGEGQQGADGSVVKGKVLYMSPEQCLAQPVDRRADVYGVGAVLYELLTGKVPFRARNAYETMRAIVESELVRPRHLAPDLDPALEEILLVALARSRDDRFATARDMHQALESYATSKGVFLSPLATAGLVETVAPRGDAGPPVSTDALPAEIVTDADAPEVPAAEPPAPDRPLYVDDRVTLRKVGGVMVLSLRGVLDEGFDPRPFAGRIYGDLLVDTSGVERVTSFGIRSLLTLWSEIRPNLHSFTHARCSVSFLSQVVMIRSVLGGGRVYSFQLPYVDPTTGDGFTVTLAGEEARRAVLERRAPPAAPPWDPHAKGEIDDDEATLLALEDDLVTEPPAQVLAALRLLEGEEQRLDVELEVSDGATRLTLRRPLRGRRFRWARVVQALEGHVEIDLSEVPSVDDAGCQALSDALLDVEGLAGLRLVGAPPALCRALRDAPERRERPVRWVSLRASGRCARCGAEQALRVEVQGARTAACRRCGGAIQPSEPLEDLLPAAPASAPPVSLPPAAASPPANPWLAAWTSVMRWLQGIGS